MDHVFKLAYAQWIIARSWSYLTSLTCDPPRGNTINLMASCTATRSASAMPARQEYFHVCTLEVRCLEIVVRDRTKCLL